eukprot:COSAG02_NODE_367_length_23739_cov_16.775127_15_plen_196_part_00
MLHGGALPEPIVGSSTLIAQYISDGSVTGSGCVEMLWSICIRYITWSVLMWCGVRVCRFEADFVCCGSEASTASDSAVAVCPGVCSVGSEAPPGSVACLDCPAGTIDHDRNAATSCAACPVGRYSGSAAFTENDAILVRTCADPASAPPPPPELNACSGTGIELVDAGHMRLTSMQNNQHCTWTMTCSEPTHVPQ